jgi:hypothetical protein
MPAANKVAIILFIPKPLQSRTRQLRAACDGASRNCLFLRRRLFASEDCPDPGKQDSDLLSVFVAEGCDWRQSLYEASSGIRGKGMLEPSHNFRVHAAAVVDRCMAKLGLKLRCQSQLWRGSSCGGMDDVMA